MLKIISKASQALLLSITTLPACAADEATAPVTEKSWYQPAAGATWQWQLSGDVNTDYKVDIYDIDLFDSTESMIKELQSKGSKVICYFSAGSYEQWRDDAEAFKANELGSPLDGWEEERWLDIRSDNVLTIMAQRLDLAAEKGCDGVEPDNVDGYSNNTGFELSAADQLNYNRKLANTAHERGLSVGLKNDVEQVAELVEYFDFAVNEQCFEYEECGTLTPFIKAGKAVLSAEYKEEYVQDKQERAKVCEQASSLKLSALVLPLELDDAFRFSCF